MKKEIEVKLKISRKEFDDLVKDKNDYQFERTYGFFTENYNNRNTGIFPRIKEVLKGGVRKANITIKVKNNSNQNFFERDEFEFILNPITDENIKTIRAMFAIFEYKICEIFEKKRHVLNSINNCEVVVDELPFGFFSEIEGEEEAIEKTIRDLGLVNNERIAKAYLRVWDDYKIKNELDMTTECIFKS